jgi:hypothetical protein
MQGKSSLPEQDAGPSCWSLREKRCFFACGISFYSEKSRGEEKGDTAVYLD